MPSVPVAAGYRESSWIVAAAGISFSGSGAGSIGWGSSGSRLFARSRFTPSHLSGRTKNYHGKFRVFVTAISQNTQGESHSLNRRRWAATTLAVLLIVIAGVAAFRFSGQNFQWAEFIAGFRSLDLGWAAASVILNLLTYIARIVRWQIMIRPVRLHASLPAIASATAIGFTAVIFFGRPGEFVRPWLIARSEKVTFSSQAAAWFLERIFDLLSVVLLFGWALSRTEAGIQYGERMRQILNAAGWFALTAGVGCIVFLTLSGLYSGQARRLCNYLSGFLPARIGKLARGSLDSFLAGLSCTSSLRNLISILLWTVLEWGLVCGGMYSLFQAFGPTAGFTWNNTLVYTGFVAFGSVVQLPGIGGGMQVASVFILTELFGIALEPASACTLLVWGTSWLSIMPFGLGCAFMQGLRWSSLRHVAPLENQTSTQQP